MALEVSLDAMTHEARFAILECAHYDNRFSGRDPLELILELEQLALEEGFTSIHDYIIYYHTLGTRP